MFSVVIQLISGLESHDREAIGEKNAEIYNEIMKDTLRFNKKKCVIFITCSDILLRI